MALVSTAAHITYVTCSRIQLFTWELIVVIEDRFYWRPHELNLFSNAPAIGNQEK